MARWFGPKFLGRGALPVSWQGWLVSALLAIAAIVIGNLNGVSAAAKLLMIGVLVVLYLIIVAATFKGARLKRA